MKLYCSILIILSTSGFTLPHPDMVPPEANVRVGHFSIITNASGGSLLDQHNHFQVFLDHANQDVELERPKNILICDNATWHKKKSLQWGAFEPMFLPPYSPDLSPIDRLWQLIKAEWFADFFAKTRQQLLERIDQALLWLMNRTRDNQTTCSLERFR